MIHALFVIILCPVFSQQTNSRDLFSFTGKVIDEKTNEAIEYCHIVIPGQQLWSVSGLGGSFTIPQLRAGTYNFEVSYVGYQKYTGTVTIGSDYKPITIKLSPLSLELEEVVVTAKEQKMGSISRIGETSIQHIQAKSVEDMLQLVPGNLTTNPSLNTVAQAYIREISPNSNNSAGVAVVLDGAPLSNEANLQSLSTAKTGNRLDQTGSGANQTVAGRGLDLRILSPDNVESVEVIRGVPSVMYGNLTSGAMIVKTRSGATPWNIKAKTDAFSKMIYIGKGFLLGGKWGAVNLSGDYSQSYSDIREKYRGFDRVTANFGYSNTFMESTRPLTFNLKFAFYQNINDEKSDPQMRKDERIKNTNQGIRVNLEGNWRLNSAIATNLGYSFMVSSSHQKDYKNSLVSLQTGITPIGNSYVDGEYQSFFLNSSYYSEYTIDGRPLDVFGQIKADRLFQFSANSFNTITLGADWKYDKNNGDGLVFDPMTPPFVNDIQTVRPRSNRSIPATNIVSFFLEDKAKVPVGSMWLSLQGGVRLTNMIVNSYQDVSRDNFFQAEPRVNVELNLLNKDNNSFLDELSLVGGYGIASKMPSLLFLYPDIAYFDAKSFAYLSPDLDFSKSLAVMTTKVINDTSDPNLKPSKSRKAEIGLAIQKKKVSGHITYFNEKHTDEFSFITTPFAMSFRKYLTPPPGTEEVSYVNGQVYYQLGGINTPLGYETATYFYSYNLPTNNNTTNKQGVEYSFNFGQLSLLKTSLIVDGSWILIKRQSTRNSRSIVTATPGGQPYPYVPIYPAGSGNTSQRVNTNFRFITHIPQLKIVFSTTAQVVWYETSQSFYQNDNGEDLFYMKNGSNTPLMNPIGYTDMNGNLYEWKPEYTELSDIRRLMIIEYSPENYFGKETYPFNMILNFRLTKEFGNFMEFSFIANNFLKTTKYYKMTTSQGYALLTIPMYFGAEITIKF